MTAVPAGAVAPPPVRFTAGWVVVVASFTVLMVSSGLGFYGLSVYLAAITREQGFSTGSVSAATSVFFIVSGITGRLVAPLIARIDVRWVLMGGASLSALSLLLLGRVTSTTQVFLVYVLFGAGFAAGGLVPTTTVLTRWFHRRRAMALSIASTGLSVGGLTLTRMASSLISDEGMEAATPWLALTYLVVMAIAVPFVYPSPASRGLRPDGGAVVEGAPAPVVAGVPYERAVRSRYFGLATAAFVCFMGAQVGAIAQLAKLGEERVDVDTGALALSILALCSVMARLLGGVLAPRLPLTGMTAWLAAVQSIALVSLAFAGGEFGLLASSALFGATVGNLLMLQPLLMAEVFGVLDYPRVFSLNQLIVSAGVAAGPFLLGVLHDSSGYRIAYLVAGALSLLGAALLWSAGPADRAPGGADLMHPNVQRVVDAAAGLGLDIEVRTFPEGTKTAADAAAAIGVEVGQIVKSLVFAVDGDVVMALVSGANQLDERKLAAAAGSARARRVDADAVREATGFPIGGVPPFGHATSLRVFVDPDLLRWDAVWAAAGTWHDVFGIAPGELVKATGGEVIELRRS